MGRGRLVQSVANKSHNYANELGSTPDSRHGYFPLLLFYMSQTLLVLKNNVFHDTVTTFTGSVVTVLKYLHIHIHYPKFTLCGVNLQLS